MSKKMYRYFLSEDVSAVRNVMELIDEASGGNHVSNLIGSFNPAYPGMFACVTGKGSEAPNDNLGCNAIEAIRVGVYGTNPHPHLTEQERTELIAIFDNDQELEYTWFWPPEEE